MPELPEAKRSAAQLHKRLENAILYGFLMGSVKAKPEDTERLAAFLPCKIVRVFSRGKKVIFHLNNGVDTMYIVSSLGMTGKWMYRQTNNTVAVLDVVLSTEERRYVYFDDQRHFGGIKIASGEEGLAKALEKVGYDWLQDDFPVEFFLSILFSGQYNKITIANFLMQQGIFAGVGNYLKSEILYCAKVMPTRRIGTLSREEGATIYYMAKYIMQESYEAGGFTIESFLDPEEIYGQYQARVYKKERDAYNNIVHSGYLPACGPKQKCYWVLEVQDPAAAQQAAWFQWQMLQQKG